jgi:hypothetical protein
MNSAFAKLGVHYKSKSEYDATLAPGDVFQGMRYASYVDRRKHMTWYVRNHPACEALYDTLGIELDAGEVLESGEPAPAESGNPALALSDFTPEDTKKSHNRAKAPFKESKGEEEEPSHPTSLQEATQYFLQIGKTQQEAARFHHYYQQRGWRSNNDYPIQDWKAAADRWCTYGRDKPREKPRRVEEYNAEELRMRIQKIMQERGLDLREADRMLRFYRKRQWYSVNGYKIDDPLETARQWQPRGQRKRKGKSKNSSQGQSQQQPTRQVPHSTIHIKQSSPSSPPKPKGRHEGDDRTLMQMFLEKRRASSGLQREALPEGYDAERYAQLTPDDRLLYLQHLHIRGQLPDWIRSPESFGYDLKWVQGEEPPRKSTS